ncbi:MAG: long-chain fatty acid--CoA ligase [Spirochaetales bacterium]|nr:long-chain fatty acid--CoA ligase [Spirochaetales bacterium]
MSIEWLIERFREYGDREAVVSDDISRSYRDIVRECDRYRAFVADKKIREGEVVILENEFSIKTFAFVIALIENRNIIAPVTASGPEFFKDYVTIAEADKIVRIDDQDVEIQSLSPNKSNPLLKKMLHNGDSGLILFTSGSSGKPKAVLHNFDKLLNTYREKKKRYRTLLFLLFDHIGGMNTLFYTLAGGGTIIQALGKDVHSVCGQIEKNRVELLPTTPTFLTLLYASESYRNYDLSSLKLITYGTEPMQETLLSRLCSRFPLIRFKQTYGTSELGILRLQSKSSDSTWMKLDADAYQVKVVKDTLYLKTDTAMEGYLNAPDPFDEEGWYNTGDKVVLDGDYIKILGRDSDIINVGGVKVFPAEIEDLILQMPGIRNAAVIGEKNPITGNIVAVKVNIGTDEDAISLKRRIRDFCGGKLKPFMIPAKVYIVEEELYNARFKRIRSQGENEHGRS